MSSASARDSSNSSTQSILSRRDGCQLRPPRQQNGCHIGAVHSRTSHRWVHPPCRIDSPTSIATRPSNSDRSCVVLGRAPGGGDLDVPIARRYPESRVSVPHRAASCPRVLAAGAQHTACCPAGTRHAGASALGSCPSALWGSNHSRPPVPIANTSRSPGGQTHTPLEKFNTPCIFISEKARRL